MAEIKIEKKKPIWPWVVGLLVLAAIIGYFVFMVFMNDDDPGEKQDSNNITTVENDSIASASEISDYISYVNNPEMGLDHEFSSGAIEKLVSATRATAEALNVDIEADLSQANRYAGEITKDPSKLDHADKIKKAAQSITLALKKIQTEKFPQLESEYNEIATAEEQIDPATPTLQQKDTIKMYFDKAANLLNTIKNNYGK